MAIQARIVHALLMREIITRFGRNNIGFVWLFLEPILFTLGIAAIWTFTRTAHGSQISPAEFALTGYSCLLIWRNVTSRCIKAIEPNMALMFHRNVKVIDILIARCMLEIVGVSASFLLLGLGLAIFGYMQYPENVLLLMSGWVLFCWFAIAMGILVAALSEVSPLMDRFWHIAVYLMFPFSGAVFLLQWFSPAIAEALMLVPMVNLTEMVRDGYFGSLFTARYDIEYACAVNISLTLLAMASLKYSRRRLEI